MPQSSVSKRQAVRAMKRAPSCFFLTPRCYFTTLLHCTSVFLLRKCPAIKMTHEHLHQRRAMQVRQAWNLPYHANGPEALDGSAILAVLIADQHHTLHRQLRAAH